MTHFILASLSPRRRELLQLCGYPYDIKTVPVDESSVNHPDPVRNCVRTAQLKAQALANSLETTQTPRSLIIAADTIVAVDGQMLGKPGDSDEAHQMLRLLRDRTHEVHTGVSVIELESGREVHGNHTAEVAMRFYSDKEIVDYIATGDPLDKAGAYAIQHPLFKPVAHLKGCFLGVMGLSICHLLQLLSRFDIPLIANMAALKKAHQQYQCPVYDKTTQKHSK
jgi:MAF protein